MYFNLFLGLFHFQMGFSFQARLRLPENLKVPQKIEMGKIWEDLGKEEKAKKGSTEGDDWKDTMRSARV